jgi:putative DNA primase/helicase
MTSNEPRGATAGEWFHFDFVLGLGGNLLPCVPAAADVRVVEGSALEGKVGKIPSQFNAQGLAHGLKEWQKRPILANELAIWSKDPRLNICVRTGPISGVYAFDVDISDSATAEIVGIILWRALGALGAGAPITTRTRENSSKFLMPFRMETPCKKRKIKLDNDPKGPAIELLADGQQFVAAGSHSSGVRYRWLPELPTEIPTLTMDQVEQIWTTLTQRFAMTPPPAQNTRYDLQTNTSPATSSSPNTTTAQLLTQISDSDWSQLIAALRFLTDKVGDNDVWSQIGYALLSLQSSRQAEQLWVDFSKKAAGYEPGAPDAWWNAHKGAEPRTDFRYIFTLARRRGWGATSDPAIFSPVISTVAGGINSTSSQSISRQESPEPGPEQHLRADGATATEILGPPGKPIVQLIDKNFSQIIDQLERIAEPEMFKQGTTIVILSPAREDEDATVRESADKTRTVSVKGGTERDLNQITLLPVTKAYARKRFGELATFQRYKATKSGGEWVETGPSAEHINNFLEQGGAWKMLKPLDAIARAPFIRRDGSICDKPGYDRASGTYLILSATFPDVPRDPSHSDALSALGRLRGVFYQFPWATEAAESAFFSHVLSEAGRLAFNKCPMFFYSAPSAGTGKTLLQKAAAIIAHGNVPALRPWVGADGDEVRKTIYASLLAGDRSLLFDNVPGGVKIRSAELAMAVTAEEFQDRKLGESEARAVPNKAVFSASGNNVIPAGEDLPRRSIVIRLDANTEKLSQRRFDIEDLESYLVRERPNLLVDALTVISAYHRTPVTDMTMPVPLASFEQWSHFVREPLIWLGMPDPVDTQKREASGDVQNLGATFELLHARFGAGEFSGVDIAHLAGGISDQNGQLTNALLESGCRDPNSPRVIGQWLGRNRDKVFKGMKLVGGAHGMMGTKWKFVKVE